MKKVKNGQRDAQPTQESQHRRLGLVQTGGTIASVKGPQGTDLALAEVITGLLGDEAREYEVITRRPYHILSENAQPDNWKMAAEAIAELVRDEEVDGVVVTHGTDTMIYTAAALSFMLRPVPVPIILTGSMLSSDDPDTDGRPNVIWSVRAAMDPHAPHEVAVMFGGGATAVTAYYAGTDNFHDQYGANRLDEILIRGTRAKKVSAWPDYFKPAAKRYAAFQSLHTDILGAVPANGNELIFNTAVSPNPASTARLLNQPSFQASTDLDTRVIALRVYPGIEPQLLVDLVAKQNYRGIILEAYGDGTMPSGHDYSLHPAIQEVVEQGVCVCITSSVLGPATTEVYAGTRDVSHIGAVPLLDMSTECALVKLMWVLAHASDPAEARTMMRTNLAGEIATT